MRYKADRNGKILVTKQAIPEIRYATLDYFKIDMYTEIAIEDIAISEIILATLRTPRQGPHPGPRASLHAYCTPGSSWVLGRTCVRCGPHGQEMQSYVSVCLFRSTFTTRYSSQR